MQLHRWNDAARGAGFGDIAGWLLILLVALAAWFVLPA